VKRLSRHRNDFGPSADDGQIRLPHPVAITVHGVRPLAINKKQAGIALGSIKSLQRMLWCARHQPEDPWLKIVREGGQGVECLIDTASLEAAYARIYCGETPPLLPSEKRAFDPTRN
jgi:hypothetical protein